MPMPAYFAAGIQDEILTRLAKIGSLQGHLAHVGRSNRASGRARSRTSRAQLGVANIARRQRAARRRHRARQRAADPRRERRSSAGPRSYDRTLDDVLSVENDIAGAIATALAAKITPERKRSAREASRPRTGKPTSFICAASCCFATDRLTSTRRRRRRARAGRRDRSRVRAGMGAAVARERRSSISAAMAAMRDARSAPRARQGAGAGARARSKCELADAHVQVPRRARFRRRRARRSRRLQARMAEQHRGAAIARVRRAPARPLAGSIAYFREVVTLDPLVRAAITTQLATTLALRIDPPKRVEGARRRARDLARATPSC